jgi:hypothetical protein
MTKLPKIQSPIFELTLPSTGESVKYRSFTVKEEKILLIAQETKDIEQALLSIKQVVNNCLIGKDVDDISIFDLEYILMNVRAKSIDNTVKFSINDYDTGEKVELELDLNEIKVNTPENHTKEIRISDDYVLYMRYPTIDEFGRLIKNGVNDPETNYDIMLSCMDKLAAGDGSIYKFSDFSKEDVDTFAQDLTADVIKKIKNFFDTMPRLRHEIEYKDKNGKTKKFVIEGMETFFT